MSYNYIAYGLNIQSEFPLPELLPGIGKPPDVHIRYGKAPESLSENASISRTVEAIPGTLLVRVHKIANYLVEKGRDITVERCPGSPDEDVRVFLLGTTLGGLLHQRRLLALHASAIQTQHGAVIFVGKSGSGKSTLMASFLQHGYPMLSDDIVAVRQDSSGSLLALPALPRVNLWTDSISTLKMNTSGMQHKRKGLDKYLLPVQSFCNKPLPVYAVYVLTSHNRPEINLEPLRNSDGFTWLLKYTYRKRIMRGLGIQADHFNQATAVVACAKMFRITRPATPFLLDELVLAIKESWN